MCIEATPCEGACTTFQWRDGTELIAARKIAAVEFLPSHAATLKTGRLTAQGKRLVFDDPAWRGIWLGAGEEKAVFLIVDDQKRAFALELLDRHGYREGKLTEGHYYADICLPHLQGASATGDATTASLFGLRFSGNARAREFIYGYTLADLHAPQYRSTGFWSRTSASVARSRVWLKRRSIAHHYADAHDANVMIELMPVMNPEGKTHYGLPLLWRDLSGHLQWYIFRLTPIDVRPALGRKVVPIDYDHGHRIF